jgi:hypothetical protein
MESLTIWVVQQFLTLLEAEIKGLLHPAQANLGYFLAWFQSLQLPSTQSESPLTLIPFIHKSHVYVLKYEQNSSFFIFRPRLTITGLAGIYYILNNYSQIKTIRSSRWGDWKGTNNTLQWKKIGTYYEMSLTVSELDDSAQTAAVLGPLASFYRDPSKQQKISWSDEYKIFNENHFTQSA